jgi:hypothetical protein
VLCPSSICCTAICFVQDLFKVELNVDPACFGSVVYSTIDGKPKAPFFQLRWANGSDTWQHLHAVPSIQQQHQQQCEGNL